MEADHGAGLYAAGMALRAVTVCVVVLFWYFVAPLDRAWSVATGLALGIGVLLVAVAGCWQIFAVARSPYPRLRAVGALMGSFPVLILLFATAYLLMAQDQPQAFSERLTRLGALYLAMTVFSTVGFGDITPVSDGARILVIGQMLADLIYVGLLVRAIVAAGEAGAQRRGRATQAPARPPDGRE